MTADYKEALRHNTEGMIENAHSPLTGRTRNFVAPCLTEARHTRLVEINTHHVTAPQDLELGQLERER